jgi:ethanolamine utilization protein EutN
MPPSSGSSTTWRSPQATELVQLAKVIGDVIVTHKDHNLHGLKLMVLQPLAADGSAAGRTLVAVDAVGAGVGETVFFVRGKEASFPFFPTEVPTDAGIVGIVDQVDLITS